eukprot:s3814_g3.t1
MSRYRAPDADGTPFVQHRERALNLPQECARENTFVPAPRAHKKQPIDQRTHGRTESFSKRKHGSKLAFCRLIDRLSLQPAGAPCVNYHISFLDAGVRYAYPTSACLDQEGGGCSSGPTSLVGHTLSAMGPLLGPGLCQTFCTAHQIRDRACAGELFSQRPRKAPQGRERPWRSWRDPFRGEADPSMSRGSYLLTWIPFNTSAPPDIPRGSASGATEFRGRLYFQRPVRKLLAAGNVLAFRRLVRERSRQLAPLVAQPEYPGRVPCVPVWKRRAGSVAAFIHVAKSGGTAFRDALLRGPGAAGGAGLRVQPNFPSDVEVLNATSFAVGRLRWAYSKQNALEMGSIGMVPKGELAWELQVPRMLAEATAQLQNRSRQEDNAPLPCLCTLHFDFSIVQPLFQSLPANRVLGFAIFRNPLQRYLSHFHFARRLDWTARLRIRRLNPVQYLYDPAALLDTLMVWQDGMAGTAWLSGLSVHVGAGSTRQESDNARMRAMFRNRTATLVQAVQNYHKLTFVGLLEDLEGSLRLSEVKFQIALGSVMVLQLGIT